jgi:hypothetical protein
MDESIEKMKEHEAKAKANHEAAKAREMHALEKRKLAGKNSNVAWADARITS